MATRNLEDEVDALRKTLDEIRGNFRTLTSQAGSAAGEAVEEGSRRASRAKRTALRAVDDAGTQLRNGSGAVEEAISERPLASVGIAFAAGVVLSRLILR